MGFGGNNGLTDFKDILGFSLHSDATRLILFSLTCLALGAVLVICLTITSSRFGQVLIAIRDAENRARFLGYRVETYKVVVFTVSAAMAGIAGALYVPQVGIINPGEFAPANSIESVIWVAVGGRGTLVGPIIGAVLVNFGKSWFTAAFPEFWLFVLGALFIGVTLFLPQGLLGLSESLLRRPLTTHRRSVAASAPEAAE
jgi:urea transport system permease protein